MSGRDRILYSPSVVRRRLRYALLDHPELYGPSCATGARLLDRVSRDPDGIIVPATLLTESEARRIGWNGPLSQG